MIEITFPEEPANGTQPLPERLLRKRAVHAALGVPADVHDRSGVLDHLGRWLADPGASMADALRSPLRSHVDLSDRRTDGRRCGDMSLDAALVGMLRNMGIDPRAFALLMAFHPFEDIAFGGMILSPSIGDNMDTGVYQVSARIAFDARNDISTDAGRIEIRQELPDTIIEAAKGRPVLDIVDHPLLRGLDLVVHDLHLVGFGTRIVYRNQPSRTLWQIGSRPAA